MNARQEPVERRTAATFLGRRVLFHIGRSPLPSYAAMLYLGCVLGTWAGAWMASQRDLDVSRFVIATIALLLPALGGSRALYVLQHRDHFRDDRRAVMRRGAGGATLFGGLALVIPVSIVVLWLAHLPYWRFWDAASVTMLVGLAITRVGCLMNGCCVGRATQGWYGVVLPDVHGRWERRIPTQLLEITFAIVMLAIVLTVQPHVEVDGVIFAAVVGSYTLARFATRSLRAWLTAPRTLTGRRSPL
ncbi:MAG: prolipoprotein diacylglyceryl transferase [Actinobacteria bacterium]|nr:prolipoprotein diacylglyceryl transferase [Actinomycetota bacterium]